MSTRNIVPNSPGEGSLGTPSKPWGAGNFNNLKRGGVDVVVEAPEDGKNYVRKDGAWTEYESSGYRMNLVTTNNTTAQLTFGAVAPQPIRKGQTWIVSSEVVAKNENDGSIAVWKISAVLQREASGETVIVGSPEVTSTPTYWSASTSVSLGIDPSNTTILFYVTGLAGTAISWAANVSIVFRELASSLYATFGCTDSSCENYNSDATVDDGSCVYPSEQLSPMIVGLASLSEPLTALTVSLSNSISGLQPAFSPAVHDYHIQTSGYSWNRTAYSVVINNGAPVTGYTLINNILRITHGSEVYNIRILPVDIPVGSVTLSPQDGYISGYYLATNDIFGGSAAPFCSVYDETGAPIWYTKTEAFLNWSLQPGSGENRLLTNAVGNEPHYILQTKHSSLGVTGPVELLPNLRDGVVFDIDPHEFIEINTPYNRHGNRILSAYCDKESYGGFYIQEQNPAGEVVWEWFSADYFDSRRIPEAVALFGNINSPEAYHMNSIDVDSRTGNLLVSMRSCSAVICIEYSTGAVLWGYGGNVLATGGGFSLQAMAIPETTANTKWLTFVNEPTLSTTLTAGGNNYTVTTQYNGTAAQHDVRWRDGLIEPLTPGNHVISLFDNQSTDQAPQLAYSGNPSSPAGPVNIPGTNIPVPGTTTITPRSRACVYEIDLVNNHIIHRSSIFSTASWSTYRKSPFMGSYTILKQTNSSGEQVYTHTINFTGEHPNLVEYVGPVDGAKTKVFSMSLPGTQYRLIKVPKWFLRRENLRGSWTNLTLPPTEPTAAPFNALSLDTNLAGYWKLDNNGSGDVALTDSTANGNNLTANGSVTLGSGIIAGSAVVGGGSNYLVAPINIQAGAPFTISGWVKSAVDITSTNDSAVFSGTAEGELFVGFRSDGVVGFGRNLVAWDGTWAFNPTPDTWYQLSFTYDGSTAHVYINGAQVGEVETAYQYVAANGLKFGSDATGDYAMTGELDSVGVWNRALPDYQIHALYGDGLGMKYPFIPMGGLRLWLDANDETTIVSNDSSNAVDSWLDKSGNNKPAVVHPSATRPVRSTNSSLGNRYALTFGNTSSVSQVMTTEPIYPIGYSQLSAGTIICVCVASPTSPVTGGGGARLVDMLYNSSTQSGMGLFVKSLGNATPTVYGGYISQSYLFEKPLYNFGTFMTPPPSVITGTSAAIATVINAGADGTTAIPSQIVTALGLPNSALVSCYFHNGVIKSIVGNNVTFYGQVADQPTNNGISVGGSVVAGGALGLRSNVAIAEVMIYDRAISGPELATLVAYLKSKYGIA